MLPSDDAQAATLARLPGCATGGQACVAVTVVQGTQRQVLASTTATDLGGSGADVTNASYPISGSAPVTVSAGTSVRALVTRAGVDLDTGHPWAEVDGPDPFGRHLLTEAELRADGQSGTAPVLYPNPAGNTQGDFANFVRAERSGTDDQLQPGPDLGFFQSDQDAALEIVVHLTGQPLDVAITASPVAGDDRSYTLSCDRCTGGQQLTWQFPDGTGSSDPAPTFTFPAGFRAGTWPIALAVDDPSDGSFGAAQAFVRIGGAPSPSPSATATATGSGGDGSGHHGATHGGSGHGAGGSSSGAGHGGAASPSPTASASPTATVSAAPSIAPTPTAAPTGAPSATPTTKPTRRPRPSPTASASAGLPAGSSVSGVLLAAPQAVAPSSGARVRDVPAPDAVAAPALDPSLRVDPLVWLGVGGVLLLGLGAASESEGVRRRARRALAGPRRRWARIGG